MHWHGVGMGSAWTRHGIGMQSKKTLLLGKSVDMGRGVGGGEILILFYLTPLVSFGNGYKIDNGYKT